MKNKEIVDFLNNYFEINNIRQKDIVKKTGISQSKISLIFNKKRKLTAAELLKIIKVFDIDIKKELNNI